MTTVIHDVVHPKPCSVDVMVIIAATMVKEDVAAAAESSPTTPLIAVSEVEEAQADSVVAAAAAAAAAIQMTVAMHINCCVAPRLQVSGGRLPAAKAVAAAAVVTSLNRVGLVMHLIKAVVVRVRKRYGGRNMLESLSSRVIPTRGILRTMLL
jgi:hypothetical protein